MRYHRLLLDHFVLDQGVAPHIHKALCEALDQLHRPIRRDQEQRTPCTIAISFFNREPQKWGTTACGIAIAGWPTKKEFGFSAQIASVSGPSAGVANTARRSTGILATAASKSR